MTELFSRTDNSDRIMRIQEVTAVIGVGRSSLYKWMKAGSFPASVQLGARAIGWRSSAIDRWIQARPST